MIWPFDREYMQLALVAGLVVGACAPMIGIFLVHKRLSLMGDGIGHTAFAGVAAGLLLQVWPNKMQLKPSSRRQQQHGRHCCSPRAAIHRTLRG